MQKGLWTKGLVVGIIVLFISMSLVPTTIGKKLPTDGLLSTVIGKLIMNNLSYNDTLDQNNSNWTGNAAGNPLSAMAQSFKPTFNMLTRVKLIVYNDGTPQGNFTLSIRGKLNDTDLTSITIPVANIPQNFFPQVIWTEFDFPDIFVIPDQTYYIVCSHDPQEVDHNTFWCETYPPDHYSRGESWLQGIDNWYLRGQGFDFCFQTYGHNNVTGFALFFGVITIDSVINDKQSSANDTFYTCQPVKKVTVIGLGMYHNLNNPEYNIRFYMKTFTNVSILGFISTKQFEVSDKYQHFSLFVIPRYFCIFIFK
jgi:hypothetical protein